LVVCRRQSSARTHTECQGKPMPPSYFFNFCAVIADPPAFISNTDCAGERIFRHPQQLVRPFINDSNRHSRRVIAYPTIPNHADIELYDIAILDPPLAADAVHHFIVKRDTNVAGKNTMPEPIT